MGSSKRESAKDLRFIIVLLVVAVGLIAYTVMDSGGSSTAQSSDLTPAVTDGQIVSTQAPAGTPSSALERRKADDPFALGDPAAPVALVVFSDYRCPFCAKFSRDTEPVLIERFVDNGTLRIEWRDYPIFGDQSMVAARAARAAAAQGKFWEYNRALYAAAPERSKAELPDDALISFARTVGVPDIERFTADMHSSAFDTAINLDLAAGRSIGVPSTPAFVINDVPMLGAQPTEEFVRAIDEAAKATQ